MKTSRQLSKSRGSQASIPTPLPQHPLFCWFLALNLHTMLFTWERLLHRLSFYLRYVCAVCAICAMSALSVQFALCWCCLCNLHYVCNRPFPSSLVPLFQSESKWETILMKMTLICMRMKLHAELIFIWKVLHLDSFWNGDTRELGNGLFSFINDTLCSRF